ncbi:MAG: ABC transporter permease [Bryobacteraceae bacterium]|nr:ABC transporter permease [Bryobacteraceae bacterium]
MSEWRRKLAGRLRRDEIDAELEEEMRTHLEMKASATGDPAAARRQFGNTTLLMEDSRAAWGWPQLEGWLRDCRYAIRAMARRPSFSATVIVTLALGIGASSAIFSLIDAVLIRPLPYPKADRLVALHEASPENAQAQTPVAPGRLEDWQRLTRSFEAIGGCHAETLTDTTGAAPERLSGAYVSPRFFAVFGAPMAAGRFFTAEEEEFGGPRAAVISEGLWRRRFAADPGAVGRTLILEGQNHVIVGVASASFQYPSAATEVWIPRQAPPELLATREARFYHGIGRLKEGVTLWQAHADLAGVQKRLGELYPKTDAGWSTAVEPLKDQLTGGVRLAFWLLFGSVSVLLLIACGNVACLLLARLNSRAPEIAARCALGAGRAAIARQLLAEGLVYAGCGGLAGMAAAWAAIDLLRTQLADLPRIGELSLNARMVGIGAGISALAAMLLSLAPIVETYKRALTGSLIRGGRSLAAGGQRLPRLLVAGQLALATALLIGAGLFVRSLTMLEEAPLGFNPENVLTLRVGAGLERQEASISRHQRVMDAVAAVPGVTAVAMSSGLAGVNPAWPREFEISGERTPDGTLRFTTWRIVTAAYFQTLGIPILRGETCRMNTGPERPFQALVNQRFSERYFAGRDPIGRTILQGPTGDRVRIVGVVADAREDGHGAAPQPLIYACGFLRYWPDSDFLIQTREPAAIATAVRQAVQAAEPGRAVYSVRPLADALHGALAQTRFRTLLVGLFSMLALALAAIGLYGVMAYMVSQRRREIGIRVALGARPSRIVAEVLRSAGTLTIVGAAAGLALAAAASRTVGALLYGIRPSDAATYASATGVLVGAALLACLVPSRRAATVDPVEALRES